MDIARWLLSFSAFVVQHLCAMRMKFVWLLFAGLISLPTATVVAVEDDMWVGRYLATWIQGSPGTEGEVSIARAPNAAPDKVVGKPNADLARWVFSSPGKNRTIELRRFRLDEYEGLRTTGPIECLNGNYVALCRVKAGTTVSFDGGRAVPEKFVVRSGYFGIFMHNGTAVFELTELNSAP